MMEFAVNLEKGGFMWNVEKIRSSLHCISFIREWFQMGLPFIKQMSLSEIYFCRNNHRATNDDGICGGFGEGGLHVECWEDSVFFAAQVHCTPQCQPVHRQVVSVGLLRFLMVGLKFVSSKKATKNDKIFTVDLTFTS